MCGFSGILHTDGQPVSLQELEAMAWSLRHRGPDELCVAAPEAGVGLVHARLKVIDLTAAARQPMSNSDGTRWLLHNGEIYNFRQLRSQLASEGCQFRSQSDTEVILQAVERWGLEKTLQRLDGMFAFCLWDSRARILTLVRDRAGKKPLFYWAHSNCVVFGSEIKALLLHAHLPRKIHEGALSSLVTFGFPPPGQSCYAGIRQVPPATWLQFHLGQGKVSSRRYWTLPPMQKHPIALGQATAQAKELLTEAVTKRMVSDVPLGALLSGGIDSTIVVGLMARQLPKGSLKTFSIGFEGDRRFNETNFAEIAAKQFQTDHTAFTVHPPPFDLIEKLVAHYDEPFGDSSGLPTYLLSELVSSQVTVALCGDGGDELFAGYERFRAALLAEELPPLALKAGRALLRLAPPGRSQRSPWARARRFLESADLPLGERYLRWVALHQNPSDLFIAPSHAKASLPPAYAALNGLPREETLSALLRLNFEEYLPNDLNVKADRCTMAHGLEVRSPFLDTPLTEWAFGLPDDLKLKRGTTKWILRRALSELLPGPIRGRGKMGFGVPLAAWFRGSWKDSLCDLLGGPKPMLSRYLHLASVRWALNDHLSGQKDLGHFLWLLVTLEIWLRQFENPHFEQPQPGSVYHINHSCSQV